MSVNISLSSPEEEYFFEIERNRVVIEENLDIMGYIPLFSYLSGCVRIGIGFLDTVYFVAKGAFHFIEELFLQVRPDHKYSFRFFYYSIHGASNMIRGAIEGAFCTHIIAKCLLIYYDHVLDGRLKYPVEYVDGNAVKA